MRKANAECKVSNAWEMGLAIIPATEKHEIMSIIIIMLWKAGSGMLITKCKMRNANCEMQNVNAECEMQNAECRMLLLLHSNKYVRM